MRVLCRQLRGGTNSEPAQVVEQSAETEENTEAEESVKEEFSDGDSMEEKIGASSEEQDQKQEEVETPTEETDEDSAETEADELENPQESEKKDSAVAEQAAKNGWQKGEDGSWYYLQNGSAITNCVEKIGEQYYGFDQDGKMYSGTHFSIWKENEDGEEKVTEYYANEDGSLKRNTWVKIYKSFWYYYGPDGAGYEGVQTVNGKLYYFEQGQMIAGKTVSDGEKNYIAQEDGSLVPLENNTWAKAGNKWYYVQNGTVLKDCVQKIDNAYYGFNGNGQMYENEFFSIYGEGYCDEDDELIREENKYFANAGGKLTVNSWKFDGENWYYFGSEAKAVEGIQSINGSKYYFKKGIMQTSGTVKEGKTNYIVGSDGKLIPNKNGWVKQGNYWYYAKNNAFYENTVVQIAGKYYGFDKSGRMYSNEEFTCDDTEYFAAEDGVLYTSRWKWGKQRLGNVWQEMFCYYGNDGKRIENGLIAINGKKYLFEDGKMMQNAATVYEDKNYIADGNGQVRELKETWNKIGQNWYYVQNGTLLKDTLATIGNDRYYFDKNGQMAQEGTHLRLWEGDCIVGRDGNIQKNQMQEINDGTYLCDENGDPVDGIKEINQEKYWFSMGCLVTYGYTQIDGDNYVVGENGKLEKLPYHGWKKVGDNWYYVDHGKMVRDGAYKIGNKTYVFSKYGKMLTSKNGVQINDEVLHKAYDGPAAAEDGTMLKNTWMKIYDWDTYDGDEFRYYWQYYDENGESVHGIFTLHGKQYCISDVLYVNSIVGNSYAADENGVLKKLNNNAWTKVGNNWFYCLNGSGAKDCIWKIGNQLYGFDWNGRMYANTQFNKRDDNGNITYYRALADGRLVRNASWKDTNGDVYYYDADGKGYEGMHKVNGVTCYFQGGKLLRNAAVYDSYGTRYIINSKGIQQKMANNQWVKVDGFWYYAMDGMIQKNTVAKINGKYYGFDAQGRMYDNATFKVSDFYGNSTTYHATKGGTLLVGQQYQSGKDTYYFDAYGRGYEGMHFINGKWCVFRNGKMMK